MAVLIWSSIGSVQESSSEVLWKRY